MQVIWKRLYKPVSAAEKGTMYELKNLINQTSVPSDPQNNMNASEDFMLLVLHAHIVAAAKTLQSIDETNDVNELARKVVETYVRLPRMNGEEAVATNDKVYMYASELLSLGLLWHNFHDSTREADGERILRIWKILLVVFKSSNNYNYAKEALYLLLQYYYVLSECQKAQLLWSRCINTRGLPGKNIACDLFMEHLNRQLKKVIRTMEANVTPKAIQKGARAIAPVQHICQLFEQQTAKSNNSGHHSRPPFGKNFQTILKLLLDEQILLQQSPREHKSFKLSCTLMEKLFANELEKKISHSIAQFHYF